MARSQQNIPEHPSRATKSNEERHERILAKFRPTVVSFHIFA